MHTLLVATVSALELAEGLRFPLPLKVDGETLSTQMSKSPGGPYWEVLITQPQGPFYARAVLEVWPAN